MAANLPVTIYNVVCEVIDALDADAIFKRAETEFFKPENNSFKINLVEQVMRRHSILTNLMAEATMRRPKCDRKSLEHRVQGNEQHQQKNYIKAMELYNQSICFAELGSTNYNLGCANRSAILFEWKRYNECLDNIELARKVSFPAKLLQKLDDRENECHRLMETKALERKPIDFPLNYSRHPKVPFIVSCLELRHTNQLGRFIRTTRQLKVGDLIAIEKPFCGTLSPIHCYGRCTNCSKENYYVFIPCETCCSAMFCSEDCRDKAINSYHKYECPIINFLFDYFDEAHRLALRVCILLMEDFPNIESVNEFVNNPINRKKSVFDLDINNLTVREQYRAIHGMSTNQSHRTFPDLLRLTTIAAVLKHVVCNYSPLKDFIGGERGQKFFGELLLHNLQIASTNMHSIGYSDYITTYEAIQPHTGGAFPFLAMLNHSCAPNAVRISQGTKAYLFITRPTPAGGIIYGNYGAHFLDRPKARRHEHLSTRYYFTCKCDACTNEYPEVARFQRYMKLIGSHIDMNILDRQDFDYASDNYRNFCQILQQHDPSLYPSDDTVYYEECIIKALRLLLDALPMKVKQQKPALTE